MWEGKRESGIQDLKKRILKIFFTKRLNSSITFDSLVWHHSFPSFFVFILNTYGVYLSESECDIMDRVSYGVGKSCLCPTLDTF